MAEGTLEDQTGAERGRGTRGDRLGRIRPCYGLEVRVARVRSLEKRDLVRDYPAIASQSQIIYLSHWDCTRLLSRQLNHHGKKSPLCTLRATRIAGLFTAI